MELPHIMNTLYAPEEGARLFMQEFEARWDSFETTRSDFDPEALIGKIHQIIKAPKKHFVLPAYIRYTLEMAAAVAIVFAGSLILQNVKSALPEAPQESVANVEIYNPKGLRTTITLPDSSKVVLNADTRISYAYNFEQATRTLTLEGEAFFEIHRDEDRPFIVQAQEATLTVLGTTFNVRAYPDDRHVDATLVEGSLEVGVGKSVNLLKPGQQINIKESAIAKMAHDVDVQLVTAWIDGKLQVESISFAEFAVVLERTFKVNIAIRNEVLKNKRFTGKFDKGENLDQIIQVMQASVPFNVFLDKETNTMIIQ